MNQWGDEPDGGERRGAHPVVRLLLRVACTGGTGEFLVIEEGAAVGDKGAPRSIGRLVLEHGWVHALANLGPRRTRGEEMLAARITRLSDGATGRFEPSGARAAGGARGGAWGAVTPFHPAPVLRAHVERGLVLDEAAERRLLGARVRLEVTPHASCLAPDEAKVVALLADWRRADDLVTMGVAAGTRLARLLAFLEATGLLAVEAPALSAAWAALELSPGAPLDEVRRAYRRLARALHPDAHPGAADAERRRLAARFDAVTRAYRLLVPTK
jgi:hypothetical protein